MFHSITQKHANTSKGTRQRIRLVRLIAAFCASAALALVGSVPAQAAPLATGTIGSASALGLVTDWYDSAGNKHVLTVNAYFGNKTADSVHIDFIRLCYSGPDNSGIWVRPELSREGSNQTSLGPARNMIKGAGMPAPCTDWAVNQTWTKGSSGEVFRVTNYIVLPGQLTTIAGFYR
ncbi:MULTISPECIES: hypothetical protein [unclassified Microbacterium]|uniref:hypothetical protein n=1 Tax=unclassified Microbacterium TaxID=2609290 RepID=UPI00300F87AF